MILQLLLELILIILTTLFALLPDVPNLDIGLINSLNNVFDVIFDNLSLLGMFVRIETIKILIPLLIIAINFDHVYDFIMWVLRKIPMLNIR